MKLLTKADLDGNHCRHPNCRHDHSVLYLAPSCHPDVAMSVRYDKRAGAVIVACAACDEEVARIAPAEHGAYQ